MRILSLILFFSFVSGCKREEVLPQATLRDDHNTFACKVNGKPWVGETSFGGKGVFASGGTFIATDSSVVNFYNIGGHWGKQYITLYVARITGIGTYAFDKFVTCPHPQCLRVETSYAYQFVDNDIEYYTSDIETGQVHITEFVEGGKGVSGTFTFKAKNRKTGEVLDVTDDRFSYNSDRD